MQEKLRNTFNSILSNRKRRLAAGAIALGTIATLSISLALNGSSVKNASDKEAVTSGSVGIKIITVGSSTDGFVTVGNSWPAEIISLSTVQVQPAREGTIIEWYANIGQTVSQGQVLGKLSQPPAMPDLISMVAGEEEALARMRTQAAAQKKFTEERIGQLQQLKQKIESTQTERGSILGGGSGVSTSLSIVEVKKRAVRATLQAALTKTVPMLTGSHLAAVAPTHTTLYAAIGAQNSSLRSGFIPALSRVVSDLADSTKLPEQSGVAYFDLTIKLLNSTIPDGGEITNADLSALKEMVTEQQADFIQMLNDVKEMELEVSETSRETFEQLREIEAMISELEKELAMAEGDVAAAEKSYKTISGTVYGGYSIVAPRAGVISSIMRKPGDIVEPGMPVATITGKGDGKKIVRIRVPNNIPKPLVGETISVTRPGFAHDVHEAKIIGIGISLDDTGSYMADAILLTDVDWPTGASVRVVPKNDTGSLTVNLSSVWWGADGSPYLWMVTKAGRVYSQKIKLGRTLATSIEVLEGIKKGDCYIETPTDEISEDMLISDIQEPEGEKVEGSSSGDHEGMPGM